MCGLFGFVNVLLNVIIIIDFTHKSQKWNNFFSSVEFRFAERFPDHVRKNMDMEKEKPVAIPRASQHETRNCQIPARRTLRFDDGP